MGMMVAELLAFDPTVPSRWSVSASSAVRYQSLLRMALDRVAALDWPGGGSVTVEPDGLLMAPAPPGLSCTVDPATVGEQTESAYEGVAQHLPALQALILAALRGASSEGACAGGEAPVSSGSSSDSAVSALG